jgi:hypothetical protein
LPTVYDVKEYGATGNGTTDDTASIQAAIDAAEAVSGEVAFPPGTYKHTGLTVNTTTGITLAGYGAYPVLLYTGTGNAIAISGTSGTRYAYVTLRDLDIKQSSRRNGTAINADYCDFLILERVRLSQFTTGLSLDNCTGCKLYGCRSYDNATGVQIGTGSGGFAWFGGAWDSNGRAVLIDGVSTNLLFAGIEVDTDAHGQNGAGSRGAVEVTAGSIGLTFDSCSFFAEATPATGATVLLDGGCVDVTFNNCHFNGQLSGSASQAAIKVANASYVKVLGGRTRNHSVASFVVDSASANVLIVDPRSSDATLISGSGSTEPMTLTTENGALVAKGALVVDGSNAILRKAGALQLNKSDDTANVKLQYSAGFLYTADPIRGDSGLLTFERGEPAAPAPNGAYVYARDNGSGKTQLCVRFPTGAVQVLATEP